jgi:hypothetical protein
MLTSLKTSIIIMPMGVKTPDEHVSKIYERRL